MYACCYPLLFYITHKPKSSCSYSISAFDYERYVDYQILLT